MNAKIILLVIVLSFILSACASPEVLDCDVLRSDFDEYVLRSRLPIMENNNSLCHGLFMGSDFSALPKRMAVGTLIATTSYGLTFQGVNENVSIVLNDTSGFTLSQDYLIDMNNICRSFFMMVDSRAPSPVLATIVRPEVLSCE